MSDPITHTVNASPWLIAMATAASSYIFGLPFGVLVAAAGGSYWALYRKPYPGFGSFVFQIVAGMCISAIFIEGVQWLMKFIFEVATVPQRPLAFLLGFAVIDEPFRKRIIDFFTQKVESKEVSKP